MDSLDDSDKISNAKRHDCDSERSRSCNNVSKQRVNDNGDNVFKSDQNDSSSGSRTKNLGSLTSTDVQHTNKINENRSDNNRSVDVGNRLQKCNRLSNANTVRSDGASSSKGETYDNGINNQEVQQCSRHKVCLEKVGSNSYNRAEPSTSGLSKACDNPSENISLRQNRKRPSSLKLNRPNFDDDDSSSDTGNDDYSLGSEDGCIYTYRGGEHLADLPSSFFSLDMGLPLEKHLPILPNFPGAPQAGANVREQGSRASSPDMDFLEMDFDPGPSCEVDTGDESSPDADLEEAISMPEEVEPAIRGTTPEYLEVARPPAQMVASCSSTYVEPEVHCESVPSTSKSLEINQNDGEEGEEGGGDGGSSQTYGPYITHVNVRGEQLLVRRTTSFWIPNVPVTLHVSSGDLVSPREILKYEEENAAGTSFSFQINQGERSTLQPPNFSSTLSQLKMASREMIGHPKLEEENDDPTHVAKEVASESTEDTLEIPRLVEPPQCMVWSEREACERQVTQIGTSACGATAVVNVFIALGVPVSVEKINAAVGTRQRANNAPLPRYLLSRAVAGCTAADIVTGIQRASNGLVTARFFPTYPERAVSLSHWLADWISLGAVPILTLNLQAGCTGEIPDAWHHQMVYGVSPNGVYLCNPVECVPETLLWPRLISPSVLLVRTRDVLSRFNSTTDLMPLIAVPDRRFHTFNVLGQVVNVIREWRSTAWSELGTRTRHIRIPASYQPGVTIAALTGSEAHRRLMHTAQLPMLGAHDPNADECQ